MSPAAHSVESAPSQSATGERFTALVLPPRSLGLLPAAAVSHAMLPWIIAVVTFLMALAASLAVWTHRSTEGWRSSLENRMTIQIVVGDDEQRRLQREAALGVLQQTPGVLGAQILPDAHVQALLEPWLGAAARSQALPIPSLIDVTLDPHQPSAAREARTRVQAVATGARIDDHGQWQAQLAALANGVRALAMGALALIACALAALVSFATRASLATHRGTIEILHLLGAEDRTIGRELERRFLLDAAKGGVAGLLVALAAVLMLIWLGENLLPTFGSASRLGSLFMGLGAMIIAPLLGIVVALVATRLTVTHVLKELT